MFGAFMLYVIISFLGLTISVRDYRDCGSPALTVGDRVVAGICVFLWPLLLVIDAFTETGAAEVLDDIAESVDRRFGGK